MADPRSAALLWRPLALFVQGWRFVGFSKFSSWFLLLIVSYALVAAVNRPETP